MKNKHLLFVLLAMALTCVLLTACDVLGALGGGVTTTAPTTTVPVTTTSTTTTFTTTTATTTAPVTPTPVIKQEAELTFSDLTVTYDGEPKSIAVEGLPEGATVEYVINGSTQSVDAVALTDVGTYTILAKITLPDTYKPHADMTAKLIINEKKNYTMSGVTVTVGETVAANSAVTLIFSGALPTVSVTNLPAAEIAMGTPTVTKGGQVVSGVVNVGEYVLTIPFTTTDPEYNAPPDMVITMTVEPKSETLTDVTVEWDYETQKTDDESEGDYIIFVKGNTYTVHLTDATLAALEAKGIKVSAYTGNTATEEGSYTASATLVSEDGNIAYGIVTVKWNLRSSGWTPSA